MKALNKVSIITPHLKNSYRNSQYDSFKIMYDNYLVKIIKILNYSLILVILRLIFVFECKQAFKVSTERDKKLPI